MNALYDFPCLDCIIWFHTAYTDTQLTVTVCHVASSHFIPIFYTHTHTHTHTHTYTHTSRHTQADTQLTYSVLLLMFCFAMINISVSLTKLSGTLTNLFYRWAI